MDTSMCLAGRVSFSNETTTIGFNVCRPILGRRLYHGVIVSLIEVASNELVVRLVVRFVFRHRFVSNRIAQSVPRRVENFPSRLEQDFLEERHQQ